MAIGTPVLIGTGGNNTVGQTSMSVPVGVGGVPSGATIWFAATVAEAASAFVMSDTAGNTYSLDATDTSHAVGNLESQLWRASTGLALANGDAISLSWTTGVQNIRCAAWYSTGVHATPLDKSAVAEGTATPSPASGNITTSTSDQILIGVAYSDSAITLSAEDADFTTITTITASRGINAAYRIVTATETNQYAPTFGANEDWHCFVASYKAAAVTNSVGRGLIASHKLYRRRLY